MDNNYFQYQSGFLTEEAWLTFRLGLSRSLSRDMSFLLIHYLRNKDELRPDFRDEVDRIIAEIDGASPPD